MTNVLVEVDDDEMRAIKEWICYITICGTVEGLKNVKSFKMSWTQKKLLDLDQAWIVSEWLNTTSQYLRYSSQVQ